MKLKEKIKKLKHKAKEHGFKLKEVVIITTTTAIIFLIAGALIGHYQTKRVEYKYKNIDDNVLQEFIEVYDSLNTEYYKDVNAEKLIEGAIDGMLQALDDPYTTYMDAKEMNSFEEMMTGDYEGVGALISIDDEGDIIVSQPFEGSPAEKAGLLPLDKIISVDGKSTKGLTTEEVASMIKGEKGTDVSIIINRAGEEKKFDITRDSITINYVTGKVYEKNNKKIGYIRIETFSSNCYDQFSDELDKLEKQNIDSLIIDVRDNAGGYLDRVSEILSLFLDKSKIIYQLQTKENIQKVHSFTNEKRDYKVAVLINEYSASASEILAGAFKDSYGSEIIGVNSYGKGTVQRTYQLETGGMVKLTVEKWLTPSGKWINEKGIEPTIKVELSDDYLSNPSEENDNQLQSAIDILSK